jgi:uncharacterized protein YndB with AHSA1/START domain
MTGTPAIESEATLFITRTFAATPEQLYRAWTDAEILAQWSCPETCTMVRFAADPRVGGTWSKEHRNPDGRIHAEHGEFLELMPGSRIVYTLINEGGFYPGKTLRLTITVEFEEIAPGRTEMRFTQTGGMTDELQGWMDEGWNSCFNKLASLAGKVQT